MSTETLERIDLDALLEEDIPCTYCDKPAVWRALKHRCNADRPTYRCDPCYFQWRSRTKSIIRIAGAVRCADCGGQFKTLDEFSDYRRF